MALRVRPQYFAWVSIFQESAEPVVVQALLDNGAMTSLMREDVFRQLEGAELSTTPVAVSGGPSVGFQVLGVTTVDCKPEDMPQLRAEHTFAVASDVPYQMILGNDYFYQVGMQVAAETGMEQVKLVFDVEYASWELAGVRGPLHERRTREPRARRADAIADRRPRGSGRSPKRATEVKTENAGLGRGRAALHEGEAPERSGKSPDRRKKEKRARANSNDRQRRALARAERVRHVKAQREQRWEMFSAEEEVDGAASELGVDPELPAGSLVVRKTFRNGVDRAQWVECAVKVRPSFRGRTFATKELDGEQAQVLVMPGIAVTISRNGSVVVPIYPGAAASNAYVTEGTVIGELDLEELRVVQPSVEAQVAAVAAHNLEMLEEDGETWVRRPEVAIANAIRWTDMTRAPGAVAAAIRAAQTTPAPGMGPAEAAVMAARVTDAVVTTATVQAVVAGLPSLVEHADVQQILAHELKHDPRPDEVSVVEDRHLEALVARAKCSKEVKRRLLELLKKYRDAFAVGPHPRIGLLDPKEFFHRIDTGDAPPVQQWGRTRLSPVEEEFIAETVRRYLQDGIISESEKGSPWRIPLLFARKKNGKIRVCGDARAVNAVSRDDAFRIPRTDDMIDKLAMKRIGSIFDATLGYHQVEIEAASREKTAFQAGGRTYVWNRLTMGLRTSSQTFQKAIQKVLDRIGGDREEFCSNYVDDIQIASMDEEEHLVHLERFLAVVVEANLTLSIEKTQLMVTEMTMLGSLIEFGKGRRPDPKNVEAIAALPAPSTVKEARRFLGMVGFYRAHVRNLTDREEPLRAAIRAAEQRRGAFVLDADAVRAFEDLRECLMMQPLLAFPDWNKKFILDLDGSKYGRGCVLGQLHFPEGVDPPPEPRPDSVTNCDGGEFRPIAYMSVKSNAAQLRYPATWLEMLTLAEAVAKFHPYLFSPRSKEEGFHEAWSDHHPLRTTARGVVSRNAMLDRWALQISTYNLQVRYRPGREAVVPDALSRAGFEHGTPPAGRDEPAFPRAEFMAVEATGQALRELCRTVARIETVIAANRMAEEWHPPLREPAELGAVRLAAMHAQTEALEVNEHEGWRERLLEAQEQDKGIQKALGTGIAPFHGGLVQKDDHGVVCVSARKGDPAAKPWLPAGEFRDRAMMEHHDFEGHFRLRKTLSLVRRHFYWPLMRRDVARYIDSCRSCQRRGPGNQRVGPQGFTPVTNVGERTALDLIGPLRETEKGNRWIVTTTDTLTKFSVSIPVPNAEAATVWRAIIKTRWCYLGASDLVQTDRGANLTGNVAKATVELFGSLLKHTSAYNPAGDGVIEVYNKTVCARLCHLVNLRQDDWDDMLPEADQVYNITPHAAIDNMSPFECMYGFLPRTGLSAFLAKKGRSVDADNLMEEIQRNRKVVREVARRANREAQEKSAHRASELPQREFKVGDSVLVFYPRVQQGSKMKLARLWIGPFRVDEVIKSGGAETLCRLHTFNNKRFGDKVNIKRLKVFVHRKEGDIGYDPVVDGVMEAPEIDESDPHFGDDALDLTEWEIEEVVDDRGEGLEAEFRVRWMGFPPSFDTWEPEAGLSKARLAISDYFRRQRLKTGKGGAGKGAAKETHAEVTRVRAEARKLGITVSKNSRYKKLDELREEIARKRG